MALNLEEEEQNAQSTNKALGHTSLRSGTLCEMREQLFLIRSYAEEKRHFLSCWTVHFYEKERSSRCLHPIRSFERTTHTSTVSKSLRHVLARSERNVIHRHARQHCNQGGRSVRMPGEKSRRQPVSPMPLMPTCKITREAIIATKRWNGMPQPLVCCAAISKRSKR